MYFTIKQQLLLILQGGQQRRADEFITIQNTPIVFNSQLLSLIYFYNYIFVWCSLTPVVDRVVSLFPSPGFAANVENTRPTDSQIQTRGGRFYGPEHDPLPSVTHRLRKALCPLHNVKGVCWQCLSISLSVHTASRMLGSQGSRGLPGTCSRLKQHTGV